MQFNITEGSAFPMLKVTLNVGENVKAQSGAMVAMSEGLELEGKVDGGIGKAIARIFSGESFFMQSITATDKAGVVYFASPVPGAITGLEIKAGQELTVQKDGFLAGTSNVSVSTKVQSIVRGILSGEGLFVVKLAGEGTAFIHTYGSIQILDLAAGEEIIVNNGHIVAWDSKLNFTMTKAATSWVSAFTSGSGFVCRFKGPGRVYIQTRNPAALAAWLHPFMPAPVRNVK